MRLENDDVLALHDAYIQAEILSLMQNDYDGFKERNIDRCKKIMNIVGDILDKHYGIITAVA